jgi:hypothetical protein
MKKISLFIAVAVLSIAVALPLSANAAGKTAKSEVVMKMGKQLHLFHSGDVAAQKEIAVGDVITVHRKTARTGEEKNVGEVKVLSFIDEHYFEAEVVKGEIKIGDIAKKGSSSLLVQPQK